MKLRPELLPPELDPHEVEELTELCSAIVDRVATGHDATPLIAEFNDRTGRLFGPGVFHGVHGSEEPGEFVARIMTDAPEPVPDLTRAEAVELVRRVLEREASDRETHFWVELLARHYDQPHFFDLVFWPADDLSPDETIEIAATKHGAEIHDFLHPSAIPEDDETAPGPTGSSRSRVMAEALLRALNRRDLVIFTGDGLSLVDPVAAAIDAHDAPGARAGAVAAALLEPSSAASELFATDDELEKLLATISRLADT